MNPVALVFYKSCVSPVGEVEFNPILSLREWRQPLFAVWDAVMDSVEEWYPWMCNVGWHTACITKRETFRKKMYRSWKDVIICANYSRIKLIASKLSGPEKGDKRLATEHCLEGCKFHSRLQVGVQCNIIYNSETTYSTGLQNWKSWRKVWKLNAMSSW